MIRAELEKLLENPEQSWIDYKKTFPKNLELPRNDPNHMVARGVMLKDILALANAEGNQPRYLVWGALDLKTSRKVFAFVPPPTFDDSMFQQWGETAIEPNVAFEFSLVPWEDDVPGGAVAVFKIYPSDDRPYVAIQNVGEDFFAGQVWFRRGTKNTVALKQELQGFFSAGVRLRVGFLESDGQITPKLTLPLFNVLSIRPKRDLLMKTSNLITEIQAENQKLEGIYKPRERSTHTDPRIAKIEATVQALTKD
jgi:hypothetical protein